MKYSFFSGSHIKVVNVPDANYDWVSEYTSVGKKAILGGSKKWPQPSGTPSFPTGQYTTCPLDLYLPTSIPANLSSGISEFMDGQCRKRQEKGRTGFLRAEMAAPKDMPQAQFSPGGEPHRISDASHFLKGTVTQNIFSFKSGPNGCKDI